MFQAFFRSIRLEYEGSGQPDGTRDSDLYDFGSDPTQVIAVKTPWVLFKDKNGFEMMAPAGVKSERRYVNPHFIGRVISETAPAHA